MARSKYKNFRDGLFRVGDVVEVTVKGRSRRRQNGLRTQEVSTLTGLIIDDIGRERVSCYQEVIDPREGRERRVQQYFTFHRTDVVKITPLQSQAWANEYMPGADGTRPRRRRLRDELPPPIPEYEPYGEWEEEAAEELEMVLDDAAARRQSTSASAYGGATAMYPGDVGSDAWWAEYNRLTTRLAEEAQG